MMGIAAMVEQARIAQAQWAKSDQKRIDEVVREIARTVYDNAELLAGLTVEETGLGHYEDNVKQSKRKAEIIWHSLKDKKSVGVISRDEAAGTVSIAKPVGVVGAALPVTIPVTNFMSNAMFALKCANAIIFAPHPKAKKTTAKVAELTLNALSRFNVPDNIIQLISEPSIKLARDLMSAVDLVIATGGMGVVKAAYSSGRPAYGVGPGNVPCVFDRGINIADAVAKVVDGRSFNNGLPCACEQSVIVPSEDTEKVISAFREHNSAYIEDEDDIQKLQSALFVDGGLNPDCVGISASVLALKAGIHIPDHSVIILVKGDLSETHKLLREEKLCPVTVLFTYDTFAEAIEIARSNLEIEGRGHSASIHSTNRENIELFARSLDVARIIVNQTATTSAGGSYLNGFAPTTTLGCGTWGNNSISENLTYTHLMNVTRIGYTISEPRIPTYEEIWG